MKPAAKLSDRVAAVHAEIDNLIAKRVDEVARSAPGVPKPTIEQMLTARAHGQFCRCVAVKLLEK